MKKSIFIICMLIVFSMHSQTSSEPNSNGESNNLYLTMSPGSWSDGFSFGAGYEYQNKTIYIGPEIYYFPNLANRSEHPDAKGFDYLHAIGRIGVNKEIGNPLGVKYRFYGGTRLGFIYRETAGFKYHNLGGELGLQITLSNGLFGRLGGSIDVRTDSKLYSSDDNHTVNSVWTSLGIRF